MADRSETVWKAKDGLDDRVEFGEVIVSLNDTVTLGNFSGSTNLENAVLWKVSDGSEMTNTHAANNVITITGAGTDIRCVYMAKGVKA